MQLVACVFCGIVICQLLSCTVAQSSLTDIHRIDSVNVNVDMEIEADGTAKPSSANHNDTYPSLQSVPTVQGRDGRRRIKLDALSTSERVNVVASIARMKRDKRKRELLEQASEAPRRPRKMVCADGISEVFPPPLTDETLTHSHSSERSLPHGCVWGGLSVSLQRFHGITFCHNCPNPHVEGSFMDAWEAEYAPKDFHIHGELVYPVPNDSSSDILNDIGGSVVLTLRGTVPLVEKVLRLQAAGARAVVIADVSGECNEEFDCDSGLGQRRSGKGFASSDRRDAWTDVHIPVVLITHNSLQRLNALLKLETIEIDDLGEQVYVP